MADFDQSRGRPLRPRARTGPFPNLGDYLSQGFRVFGRRWQDWLVPMLLAGAVTLAALLCCCLPIFLVAGPLTCGLYACGLCTLRGQRFNANTLWLNWTVAGRSILAHLVIALLTVLPMILLYVFSIGGLMLLTAMLAVQAPQGPPAQPSAEEAAFVFAGFLGWMALFTLGVIAVMVWTFWIGTKTIFIMPLITDRDVGFSTAWGMSWRETRNHFWELLLLHFVGGLVASLGACVFYIGLIFTLPIYFTMIAAAYEHRFPFEAELTDDTGPSEPPGD